MDIMTLPSKETVIFYNEIRPWIVDGKRENGVTYIFSKDTPKEKLEFDKYYIQNRGFKLDLLILLKTIIVIFTRHGAR